MILTKETEVLLSKHVPAPLFHHRAHVDWAGTEHEPPMCKPPNNCQSNMQWNYNYLRRARSPFACHRSIMGSEGVATLILRLSTRQGEWSASHTDHGQEPWYPPSKRLCGLQMWSGLLWR